MSANAEEEDYGVFSFTSSTFASDHSLASSNYYQQTHPASSHLQQHPSNHEDDRLQNSEDHESGEVDLAQSTSANSYPNPFELSSDVQRHDTLIASLSHILSDGMESPTGPSRALSNSSRLQSTSSLNNILIDASVTPSSLYARSSSRTYSNDGSTRSSQSAGQLLMPSMNRQDSGEVARLTRQKPTRLLVAGKGMEERRQLVNLMDRFQSSDDLSQSIHSTSASNSHSSSNQPHHQYYDSIPPSHGHFVEMKSSQASTSFWETTSTTQLSEFLVEPLESLERYISYNYPSTEGLLDHVAKNLDGSLIACLFLFSSPPTASEITVAKSISLYLPIVPVLLLSASAKAQKTEALRLAVTLQLDTHMDWISPMYLLPNHHFESENQLCSSQEISPPESTSSYPPLRTISDLEELRDLVSSSHQDHLRRKRGESFLVWREVEIAARGYSLRPVESLPSQWNDSEVEFEQRDSVRYQLRFSRRVAERRLVTNSTATIGRSPSPDLEFSTITAHPHDDPSDATTTPYAPLPSSPAVDQPTPRCQQRSLPPRFPPLSCSPLPTATATATSFAQQSHLIPICDPFHLTSLLQLVGLNLRFIVTPKLIQVRYSKLAIFSVVSVVFLVGVAAGKTVLSFKLLNQIY